MFTRRVLFKILAAIGAGSLVLSAKAGLRDYLASVRLGPSTLLYDQRLSGHSW